MNRILLIDYENIRNLMLDELSKDKFKILIFIRQSHTINDIIDKLFIDKYLSEEYGNLRYGF